MEQKTTALHGIIRVAVVLFVLEDILLIDLGILHVIQGKFTRLYHEAAKGYVCSYQCLIDSFDQRHRKTDSLVFAFFFIGLNLECHTYPSCYV